MSFPLTLAVEHLASSGGAAHRALFLHGMLGRGNNLRSLARRFVEACPGWDALLLDLRGHGASPKSSPSPSLTAAAADVLPLCTGGPAVGALVGHSFGGKVALEVARLLCTSPADSTRARLALPLHIFTLDSNPGVRQPSEVSGPDSVVTVLRQLAALTGPHASRSAFVDALQGRGLTRSLSQWLAQSTEPSPDGGVRFALDLAELEALLQSYFATDLWPFLSQPAPGLHIHLIIGEHSTSYSPADRQRAAALAAAQPQLHVDLLPADHWVHTDDPQGVQRLLVQALQNIG